MDEKNMRNQFYNIFLFFSLLLVFVGCELDDSATAPQPPEAGNPMLALTLSSLDFSAQETELEFGIVNAGSGTLEWTLTYNRNWMEIEPTRGSTSYETDVITVKVHRDELDEGTYSGAITITPNAGNAKTITIRLSVMPPRIRIEPTTLDFDYEEERLEFTIVNNGGGTLNWVINTSDEWISTSTNSGYTSSESDPVSVWVDRQGLARGSYLGEVVVMTEVGDVGIDVLMDVGELIWSYFPDDEATFEDVWECYDSNVFSESDYWGVVPMDGGEVEYNAIWCNGVGSHPVDRYDNNMDAHMRLRSDHAIDISEFSDITINFEMAYETESPFDYVRFLLLGADDTWYYIEDQTEWKGYDFSWKEYEIPLNWFYMAPSHSLRFDFFFNSDINNGYRGVLIRGIEVWGGR